VAPAVIPGGDSFSPIEGCVSINGFNMMMGVFEGYWES
jgi:hypothetical protein